MPRPIAIAALLFLVGAAAACETRRATPRDAFDAVRSALAADDAAALARCYDSESRAYRLQTVREWRALLERGDPPEEVVGRLGIDPETVRGGTLDEAVARVFLRHSAPARNRDWFLAATVVEDVAEGPDTAGLRVRGPDGREQALWFVREDAGWTLDLHRSFRGF